MKKMFCLFVLICLLSTGTAFAKPGTLLAAFGTSMDDARPAIDAVEAAYKKAGGDAPVLLAFTSDIVRAKLAKEGKPVPSVDTAMNLMAEQGVTELTVQSLHMVAAEEYVELERLVARNLVKNPDAFKSVRIGHPLLVSQKDLDDVVKLLPAVLPKRKAGEAVLLMGHGNNRGPGDLTLVAAAAAFRQADPLVWLASVEGAQTLDKVLPQMKAAGVKRVWLQPFMIVAGDHAVNDLAGPEEDSWASILKAHGMTPIPNLVGLGQIEGIRNIFLEHTKNAEIDLVADNMKK